MSSCSGIARDDLSGLRHREQPLHQPGHRGQHPHYPDEMVPSDPFNNFDGGASVPPHMLRPHLPPSSRERDRGRDTLGRESLFSETSTELSLSSGSDKETSPVGQHCLSVSLSVYLSVYLSVCVHM